MIPRRRVQLSAEDAAALQRALSAPEKGGAAAIAAWEAAIAAVAGTPHAVAVSSGRTGMRQIFEHLGIGEGDEVIVPAYTLGELIPLIQALGAAVVPADVDPRTFNVTADAVAGRITPRTRAILALHAFGMPADMPAIIEAASARNIPVIEDCAHAFGSMLNNRAAGSYGYAGFFSFETTKPVNTFGGGAVVTSDPALAAYIRSQDAGSYAPEIVAQKLRAIRTEQRLFDSGLARVPLLLFALPGVKTAMARAYRLVQHATPPTVRYSPLQARLGLEGLATLRDRIRRREDIAARYRALLRPEIHIQEALPSSVSTWYFLVATLPRQAAPVRMRMLLKGIDAGVGGEIADDCARMLGFSECPNAAHVFANAIALPIFESLHDAEIECVAHALNRLV